MKSKNIKITDLLYKPNTKLISESVYGLDYKYFKNSPNLYVIKTDEAITDNNFSILTFTFNDINYILQDVIVNKKDELYHLECKKWKETVL